MLELKYLSKKGVVLGFCLLLICSMQASSAECTAVYVGSEVSSDGSVIFARSNDFQEVFGNHITVTPRVENESGRFMPVSMDGKVKTEIPQTTYQYTATPFMNSSREYSGLGLDAAACTNEYGVSMSMSVTAFPNEDALKADPLIKEGLTEFTANDLVVCQS